VNTVEKLSSFIEKDESSGYIIVFSQPDPDAIGSALGLEFLIKNLTEKPVQIKYTGAIGHAQNKQLVNVYDLKTRIQRLDIAKAEEEFKDKTICLVDSSQLKDERLGFKFAEDNPPAIVIDHHRNSEFEQKESNFILVDLQVKSASTLITELILEFDLLNKLKENNPTIICLTLGIYTDTSRLTRAAERDLKAYMELSKLINKNEFAEIINYKKPYKYLSLKATAYNNLNRKEERIIADVGFIDTVDEDSLAMIADEIILTEGISLVVVWGIVGNQIKIKIRSSNIANPLNEWIQERFMSYGGAKNSNGIALGGCSIPLELNFLGKIVLDKIYEAMKEAIEMTVFKE